MATNLYASGAGVGIGFWDVIALCADASLQWWWDNRPDLREVRSRVHWKRFDAWPFAISYRPCRMPQVLVHQNERHEQTPRCVGARPGTLTGKTSHYYEHGLPFLAIGHASGNYPQLVQTADVVLVMAEQGEDSVSRCVSSQDTKTRLNSSGLKKPSKRYFHTSFDGTSCPMLQVVQRPKKLGDVGSSPG